MKIIHFFCLIACLLFSTLVFAQQTKVLNSYNGESEIFATQSVTLLPGFTTNSNVRIYISGSAAYCVPLAAAPSDQNYIITNTVKIPGITNAAGFVNRGTCEINQTIQYFDGLGRPLQTVQTKGSSSLKDIIQPFEYDVYGREVKKYLPYSNSTGSQDGSFKSNALTTEQGVWAHYKLATQSIDTTSFPYSETMMESSPLSRVTELGSPGKAFRILKNATGESTLLGNTIKTEFASNALNEVKLWTVNVDGTGAIATYYEANQLYKTILKNENWTSASGSQGTIVEFKDKEGKVVLKRTFDDTGTELSTYYVYDDFGNLRYVIPPAVTINTIIENDATFNELIYAYHYDDHQRVVEKKIPAKGWEFFVYNKLDQLVLTQDAIQRNKAADEWLFTKYDELGRIVMTGLYKDGGNITVLTSNVKRIELQAKVDTLSTLWETRLAGDYSNNCFPTSISDTYIVNYYDNYAFTGNLFGTPTGPQSLMTNTLLTGTKVKVLDGGNTYLWTVNFYDNEGRVIQSKSTNYMAGQDVVDNTYDFPGQLIQSKRTHTVSGKAPLEITTRYEYDHMGRRINTFEKIGSSNEVLLASYKYNELGQQIKKQLHSENQGSSYLQTVDYVYNIRGWLKSINDANLTEATDQFGMELKYENGVNPQFNGNISEMTWKNHNPNATTQKSYQFGYDKLNRLLSATSIIGSNFNEVLTYDVMGNIRTLKRNGGSASLIDDLTYTYKNGNLSNRLESVNDQSADSLGQRKGLTSYDYYDQNGNLTGSTNASDPARNLNISYNYLNLPQQIKVNNKVIDYTYDAIGRKLRKVSGGVAVDYLGGIQYSAGVLEFVQTEEGVARNISSNYQYQYNLTDPLGNVRSTIIKTSQGVETIQESSYYAFGMTQSGWVSGAKNKYLYNGKEQQDDFDLNQYDYGARFYDPVLGRWNVVDPLAEEYQSLSSYSYVANSPINAIDPDGKKIIFVNGYYNSGEGTMPMWAAKKAIGRFGGAAYWGDDFKRGAKKFFNDNNLMYVDGRGAWNSTGKERFNAGYEYAKANMANLTKGMKKGETIKIVSHSMGSAYSEGMIKYMLEQKVAVESVVHLSAADPSGFTSSLPTTLQLNLENDFVLGYKNFWEDGIIQGVGRFGVAATTSWFGSDWVNSHASTKFDENIWKMVSDLQNLQMVRYGNNMSTPFGTFSGPSTAYEATNISNGTKFNQLKIRGEKYIDPKNNIYTKSVF